MLGVSLLHRTIDINQRREQDADYSFCVSVEGNVFPCAGWQTNIIGDLKRQTVEEIWINSKKIKELRKIKRKEFVKCVSCKDKEYCTVCMMRNANENSEGNVFLINDFNCKVASIVHRKVEEFSRYK